VEVASADVNGDGKAEFIVGSGTTGDVRVFDADGTLLTAFQAYPPSDGYYDGTRVAVGDVNGDGVAEIVTGPGRVRPVDVEIFDGKGHQMGGFLAHPQFQGGIFVAVPAPLGPRFAGLSVASLRGREGRPLRFAASFVDPRGGATPEQFAASVSWGDATTSRARVSALGGGKYAIAATHVYSRFGRYPVSIRLHDTRLRAATARARATVRDAPITARGRTLRTARLAFDGAVASVKDGNPDGSPDDLRAIVRWGDGTYSKAPVVSSPGFPSDRYRVVARHRFPRRGVYRVVVRVRSLGGSTATAKSLIRVRR
jgi:hypothetical protein